MYSTFSDKPCIITAIKMHESGYSSIMVEGVEGWKDVISLAPIPLTDEILEKNGMHFNEDGTGVYCFEEDHQFSLQISTNKDKDVFRWQQTRVEQPFLCIIFHYVHELQHALRLCGIDKEIVL